MVQEYITQYVKRMTREHSEIAKAVDYLRDVCGKSSNVVERAIYSLRLERPETVLAIVQTSVRPRRRFSNDYDERFARLLRDD